MFSNIIGAALAAAVGFLIAFANFIISKKILLKKPDSIAATFVARQFLQVAYLVLVYLIGTRIQNVDLAFLLIGAVVGMTIPMFFFTKKLLILNDSNPSEKTGKEGENNG